MSKVSRGPKDTNSSSKQFERIPGIECHLLRKAEKDKSIKYKTAKQAHVNTVDPATNLEDAQCMGRDVGNVARLITLEQYAEAKDIGQSTK